MTGFNFFGGAGIWRFSSTPAETSPSFIVNSGIADLALLLVSFLLLTAGLVCPRLKTTFGAIWIWSSITAVTLLVQTVITAYDMVMHLTAPDTVYMGSLTNSMMFMACEMLYLSGVIAYFCSEPPEPKQPTMPVDYADPRPPPASIYEVGQSSSDD